MITNIRRLALNGASTTAMAIVIVAIIAAWGSFRFGSIPAAMAYVRGERLLVDRPFRHLGDIPVGAIYDFGYTFTNMTGRSLRLLGTTTSCQCMTSEGLPLTLRASESKTIWFKLATPEREQEVRGETKIFTDDSRYPEVHLEYAARAVSLRDAGPERSQ